MELIDIILTVVLILGIIKGFRNGFFVELASLVSILLGIFVAIKFSYLTQSYLEQHGNWNPKTVQVAAFALTFVIVIIIVSMLAKIFTSIANFAFLGLLNSLLGALIGFLRTILVMSVLLNLFQKLNVIQNIIPVECKKKSVLYMPIREISKTIYPAISDWFEVFQTDEFTIKNPKQKR